MTKDDDQTRITGLDDTRKTTIDGEGGVQVRVQFLPDHQREGIVRVRVRFLSERQIDVRSSSVAVRMIPLADFQSRQVKKRFVESPPDKLPISTLELTQHAINEFLAEDLNSGQRDGDAAPASGLQS